MRLARAVPSFTRTPGVRAGALSRGARGIAMLAAVTLTVAVPAVAPAQVRGDRVNLVAGGSLPTGNTNLFGGNDDAATGPHDLGFMLNFFGITHTQLFVNNNGNVTFGDGLSTFTPFGLSGSLGTGINDQPITGIIAPFFADVDTRGGLRPDAEFVGGSRPSKVGLTSFGAYSAADNFGGVGRNLFGVTWSDVGYYSFNRDLTNTFQLLLIDRGDTGLGNFDIEFNYERMQWETGDASHGSGGHGGNSAGVGYSNGTGNPGTFLELAGSGVNGALIDGGPNALISSGFGSGMNGRYIFQVRNNGGGVPGETQQNPELPSTVIPGDPSTGQGPTYVFRGFGSGRWADPPDTFGFLYEGVNGTLFTGVGLPTGYDPFDICWGPTFTSCATGIAGGTTFDFLANAGGARGAFQVLGINPLVDSSNPNGFPTQLFFTTQTGDFDMTPLLAPTVATPEPGTWMLLGVGLVGLVAVRRRGARTA
jgi:hypothetical protein